MNGLDINIGLDDRETRRVLGAFHRQLPFATAKAINDTAKDFQRAQLARMGTAFTVRSRTFIPRSVKIKPFARKTTLEATVAVAPPGGTRTADILVKFERGGVKRPRTGGHLVIPVDARRTQRGIVRKDQRPRALHFRKVGRAFRGDRRTFLIPGVGIFQRTGRRGAGRRLASYIRTRRVRDQNIRMLFSMTRSAPIRKQLRFISTARKIIPRVFPGHLRTQLRRAIATAR